MQRKVLKFSVIYFVNQQGLETLMQMITLIFYIRLLLQYSDFRINKNNIWPNITLYRVTGHRLKTEIIFDAKLLVYFQFCNFL